MIAVDTNILVYVHRADSGFHGVAKQKLTELAEGSRIWAIPWPCIHEFLAIVTHPKIYKLPTPLADAIAQVECWLECPHLELIGEIEGYWPVLKTTVSQSKLTGPRVHDGRIAAICIHHAVKILWSADRDMNRMQGLVIHNPLIVESPLSH